MANISFDYSANTVFKQGEDSFRKYTYRDIGTLNFRQYKDPFTKEIKIIDLDTSNYDEAAVKQSLKNLFSFKPGELILLPEFGNELYRYLYEPLVTFTADKIVRSIKQMVEKWEPRIQITDIPIEADEEAQCYYIQIKYIIPTLNRLSSALLKLEQNQVSVV